MSEQNDEAARVPMPEDIVSSINTEAEKFKEKANECFNSKSRCLITFAKRSCGSDVNSEFQMHDTRRVY